MNVIQTNLLGRTATPARGGERAWPFSEGFERAIGSMSTWAMSTEKWRAAWGGGSPPEGEIVAVWMEGGLKVAVRLSDADGSRDGQLYMFDLTHVAVRGGSDG